MNSNVWKKYKLNDLGFVGRGRSRHRPTNDPSLYGGNIPFFQTGDIKAAGLYLRSHSRTYNKVGLSQSKLWEPGTLCITIAANIAETAILSVKGCFPDSVVGFVADAQNCDVRFVKYILDTLKKEMQGISRGTTQKNLSLNKLLSFDLLTPPLPTQHKIAAILSAYDDLIENNTRRIKILEEIAQTLYRHWFVDFKYPGHEDVPLEDSGTDLGQVPEGWEVNTLEEDCILIMGQSPKSEYYNVNGIGLPFHQGVTDFGNRFPVDRVYCTIENRIAEKDDILFSVRAPVGRMNIADKKIIIGRGLSAIRHRNNNQWFIFHQLRSIFFREDMIGGGTIFKSVTKKDMEDILLLQPEGELIGLFEKVSGDISEQIHTLEQMNANLRTTRVLLLPRLVSGDLDVSNMDIAVRASGERDN